MTGWAHLIGSCVTQVIPTLWRTLLTSAAHSDDCWWRTKYLREGYVLWQTQHRACPGIAAQRWSRSWADWHDCSNWPTQPLVHRRLSAQPSLWQQDLDSCCVWSKFTWPLLYKACFTRSRVKRCSPQTQLMLLVQRTKLCNILVLSKIFLISFILIVFSFKIIPESCAGSARTSGPSWRTLLQNTGVSRGLSTQLFKIH